MEMKCVSSQISVIIPNFNGNGTLRRCLEAVRSSSYEHYECIVVDDGSNDDSIEIARSLAHRVIKVQGGPLGPAHARNLGAQAAHGEILFFVDADVVIYPDTLDKVAASFAGPSQLAAVFGSYDDQPGDSTFLSQYKNLFHHFVHQQANENSHSFWSGCGAMRREIFLEFGGFDTVRYPHPSIEDIELGRRVTARGHKIAINKSIQVKHLKRWTLTGLIRTDIFDRGIPWTQLVMADRKIPNDLNLESSQRWSALCIGLLLTLMAASALFYRQVFFVPVVLGLFWCLLQCWQWGAKFQQFRMDWRSLPGIGFFLAALVGLAAWLGFLKYLPVILVLFAIVLAGPWLTRRSQFWREAVFSLMMIAILAIMVQVITTYPFWLAVLIVSLLGIFILFNRKFYAFFKEKRGMMFAIAVVPFHMLYFLYSMVAFGMGTFIYYNRNRRPILTGQANSKG